ncbi:MAG: OadG family protein [Eubacteriales bacterium]
MSYLSIYLDAGLDLGEKVALSGEMLLRGMGTVFMVLIILWGCLSLFKVFSTPEKPVKSSKPKPGSDSVKEEKPAPAPVSPVKEEPAASEVPADNGAILAAICAAIEAYRAEEGSAGLPYHVVSFKRKTGRKSWSGSSED